MQRNILIRRKARSLILSVLLMLSLASCREGRTEKDAFTQTAPTGSVRSDNAADGTQVNEELQADLDGMDESNHEDRENEMIDKELHMMLDGNAVEVEWENNESVGALMELAEDTPVTVQMSMYGGFEQVGSLGDVLPREDVQTTTQAGDIVLYSGDQIVVFYGSNSWAYTRLGHIIDKNAQELSDMLGNGDITLTLSME